MKIAATKFAITQVCKTLGVGIQLTQQMTPSLLKYKPINRRLETRAENIDNGNDAEVLAASFLVMAIGAEISWGSRNEDGRKIDLICSYDHPWFDKERLFFLFK